LDQVAFLVLLLLLLLAAGSTVKAWYMPHLLNWTAATAPSGSKVTAVCNSMPFRCSLQFSSQLLESLRWPL